MKFSQKSSDYTKPQRQSAIGMVIEMVYAFQKAVKVFWPLILLYALRIREFGLLNSLLVLLFVFLLIVISGYLNYRNFLFHIDEQENEFILRRGVFNKKKTVLAFSKIQQVSINQSVLQKIFNVYEVQIDTAGSIESEAKIRAVSRPVAEYLRKHLFLDQEKKERKIIVGDEPKVTKDSTETILKISPGDLIRIAVTSDYLKSFGLITAFVAALYDRARELFFHNKESEAEFYDYLSSLNLYDSLIFLILLIILFVFIFNLIRMLVVYFNFRIRKEGKSLQLSYGLFNTRSTLLQPDKVQIVRVVTNYIQKKMRLARIFISQASSDIGRDKNAIIQIPVCSDLESKEILRLIFRQQPLKGFMLKPDIRKVFSSVYKLILIPLSAFFIYISLEKDWELFGIVLPVYLLLSSLYIYFSFQNNRLFIQNDFIILQSGVWDIHTAIITPSSIQAISTKQNIWHIDSDVGHLILHTAGGNIVFRFGHFSLINKYVNYWLFQIETKEQGGI